MCRIDNWINKGSGWIVETIKSQYINISTYRPLIGSSYVKLPTELGSPTKGLINIKKTTKSVFSGVMLGLLTPKKYIQKELRKMIKNWLMILIMMELNFLCQKKFLVKLKRKTIFVSMFFVMKIN